MTKNIYVIQTRTRDGGTEYSVFQTKKAAREQIKLLEAMRTPVDPYVHKYVRAE